MTQRRCPQEATSQTHYKATGHREASAFAHQFEGASVRELLVAGGLRGFSVKEALA